MGAPDGTTDAVSHRSLLADPRLISLVLVGFIGPMSVNVVSPALPRMANALAVSDARIGLVITAITLPPLFLAPVAGVAGDIYSRRVIVLGSLFVFGVAGTAIAFVDTFEAVLVLRAIQGVTMAGIAPMAITLLGDLYAGAAGSTAQGLRTSATGLSAALTPLVAGAMAAVAWNVPFALYAFTFVAMAFVYVYVPETARGMDGDAELAAELRRYGRSMRDELDRDLFVITAGGFVRFFVLFALLTFVPLFASRELGASPVVIGAVLATKVIRVVVAPATGLIVSRVPRRQAIAGSLALMAGSALAMPFSPGVVWLGVLMTVNSIGDAVFAPLVDDTVTGFVSDENRSGTVSILRVLKEAGKTAAPVGLGVVLAVTGFDAVFLVTAAVAALYVLPVLFLIDPPEARLAAAQGS